MRERNEMTDKNRAKAEADERVQRLEQERKRAVRKARRRTRWLALKGLGHRPNRKMTKDKRTGADLKSVAR